MTCPLCGRDATITQESFQRLSHVVCPACGHFQVQTDFLDSFKVEVPPDKLYLLSALTRRACEDDLEAEGFCLTTEHLRAWRTLSKPSLPDLVDELLVCVHSRMKSTDSWVALKNTDYPLITADSPREFNFVIERAILGGYLEPGRFEGGRIDLPWVQPVRLTTGGWNHFIQLPARRKTDQAFVAHWFTKEMASVYQEGFYVALKDAGWTPLDLGFEHNDDIVVRALAEIRRSSLVVADCTGNRPSVLFEAGFAMGLGIPVLFTCSRKSKQRRGLTFDTSHYNHLIWKDVGDLRARLTDRVNALYPGPHGPPR